MLHVVMAPALLSKPKIIFGGQTKLPSETTVSTTAPRQMLSSTYGEYNSPVRVLQIETRYPIRYYAVGSEVVCWSGTKQQQKLVVLVHKRHSQDSCETVSCSSLQADFVSRVCLTEAKGQARRGHTCSAERFGHTTGHLAGQMALRINSYNHCSARQQRFVHNCVLGRG
jgi:hypothetical protein